MYITLFDLFWLLLTLAIVLFWYRGLQVRELALKEAKRYCDRLDLQLLDQTIALRSMAIRRNQQGQLGLVRSYRFEFTTTGDERYQGRVWMMGRRLSEISSDAHRIN